MDESSGNYLPLILVQNLQDDKLTSNEISNIQLKLWALLGKRTERFTTGDSSSVPIETAEELFKSICFSINMYLKSSSDGLSLLKSKDTETLLKLGWSKIESEIETGKELLKKAQANALPIENISFNDTLHELSTFFKKYDYRFFAHEIPCSIDYQLCHPISEELYGIEYINEYLRRLIVENELCQKFDIDKIKMLLKSYCPDFKELLINIYEPIITNAVGLVLLDRDIDSLDITGSDRNRLILLFSSWSEKEAIILLRQASEKLCCYLQISNTLEKEYLKAAVVNLYPRIAAALPSSQLDNIFLSLSHSEQTSDTQVQFIDEDLMDDEQLRTLIDEIRSCRYLSDKIAIFKQQVHSLRDSIEILNTCFWGDECIELYNALDKTRLALLLNFIYQKQNESPDWSTESGWDVQLKRYISEVK